MRVIISGGGTGGHVFPAIAIADALKSQAPDTEILFVGAEGKIEMEKVPKAGYNIIGLKVAGFQRSLTLKNLLFPFKLIAGLWKALQVVRNFKPDVAVGVGGYASGPILKVANLTGIKTVLQEQNSYAGVTNRLLADKASKICVAYEGMERFFPAEKIIFTGNPIRQDILNKIISPTEARMKLGLDPSKKTVLIFGGSLGAKSLNEAILMNIENWTAQSDINIIWQVGKLYFDHYRQTEAFTIKNVKILPFIEDMDVAYSAADLVVCRAGALTISELAVLGKAAILVPSPNVAEDHQTVNAMSLVSKEAAVLIKDSDAKLKLIHKANELLENDDLRTKMSENIKFFSRTDAAVKIADEILKLRES
ncbi:MAG: undecaprenyldiphospho-muramoylpentapeptide beta-N-acetylglucosaminyltransferase [Saprospiraceae bacterium]|nr:undecaprenyldiphospho-muramoylpentapeptide beta-N-acetylglucosaminyltransferase [Saprospiraceae bacterium]